MKSVSVSISGSGQVSNDAAEKLEAVKTALEGVRDFYVSLAISDIAEAAPTSPGQQAGADIQAP